MKRVALLIPLSVFGTELAQDKQFQGDRLLGHNQPHISAGRSIPFALVLQININVLQLEPYDGLDVMEANGGIEAIDTRDGKIVALENISKVRGFGMTPSQAKADVMKNVGEGVSESFINLVAEKAH